MDELISRKAVLELPRNITRNMRGKVVEESIDVELIEALEAYVPDKNVGKTETSCESNTEITRCSDDTISRQAAIDSLHMHLMYRMGTDSNKKRLDEWINNLPSAQPKRGKWILDRSGAYCCSECMEPCAGYVMMKPRDRYCRMCGSRNEVTE